MSDAAISPVSRAGQGRPLAARGFHHGNLRQALLDAALAAPDIEGLSLRQLATGLGVTPAAAYRHFANREELLVEAARVGFDRLEARFARAFDVARPPRDAAEARARLLSLAQAYLAFADAEPALWRLMFGAQVAAYRADAAPPTRRNSYDYLPAALLGLHRTAVVPQPPDERDALFAWSAIHGAAALRIGRVPAALGPSDELAAEVATRVIQSLWPRAPSRPVGRDG
jgi:AcrR family transcriptional regulator